MFISERSILSTVSDKSVDQLTNQKKYKYNSKHKDKYKYKQNDKDKHFDKDINIIHIGCRELLMGEAAQQTQDTMQDGRARLVR